MDRQLTNLATILDTTDQRLRAGGYGDSAVWRTGFESLDWTLGGGLRSGNLALLAGPQGLGKTTFCLQVARNIAHSGRAVVYFSYEHEPHDLMERLVTLEAAMFGAGRTTRLENVRSALESHTEPTSLEERLAGLPGGVEALDVVRSYADLLHIHRSTGTSTDLTVIQDVVRDVCDATKQVPLVVVDYLQKVKVHGAERSEEDRTSVVVEGLKDYAMESGVPLIAVVAATQSGLESGKRMRINHMRGSSSLGYEADIVLILNSKYDIVARHHLVYDVGNAERFRQWAVLSVEKNRSGQGGIDLEFRKRFDQCRFEVDGQRVVEQLIDERIFTG